MSRDLNAPRIREWVRWFDASSKMDPEYKPKALLAVLRSDGKKMLLAVLRELSITRPEELIEGMLDTNPEDISRKDDGDASGT